MESHERRKEEPPILPSPGMARDAAKDVNLRRVQAKEPPTSQVRGWRGTRRRMGTSDASKLRSLRRGSVEGRRPSKPRRLQLTEERNLRRVRAEEPPTRPS